MVCIPVGSVPYESVVRIVLSVYVLVVCEVSVTGTSAGAGAVVGAARICRVTTVITFVVSTAGITVLRASTTETSDPYATYGTGWHIEST